MKNTDNNLKFILYARKSSENEDRQVQSIEDQTERLEALAKDYGLTIIDKLKETKSAKEPNARPVFNGMLERIEKGEANGILCWKLNRLSRNPVDSGRLSWMLQTGIIQSIQTYEREYLSADNVLLFNVETGMANQYVRDLSTDVKRGLKKKFTDGWKSGVAPPGYINNIFDHTIADDQKRFHLIRRVWDYMLTGNYTPSQILDLLNNEWGYRSIKRKKIGGKPMALSTLYRLLSNEFYSGILIEKGNRTEGKHKKMITLDEFDKVQALLGRKGRPRPKKNNNSAYTGNIVCEECGCMYTNTIKEKLLKSTGELKEFNYYHCTKKKKDVKCQAPRMTLDEVEEQIETELERFTILPQFKDWALEILNRQNDTEIEDRTKVYKSLQDKINKTQNELDNLTRMRYRELIDDETFIREKKDLVDKITNLKTQLRETESRAEKWLELTEKTFEFAAYARHRFVNGDNQTKREIFTALGQNFSVKDKKLKIIKNSWFIPIEKGYPELEAAFNRLEMHKTPMNKEKDEALTSLLLEWQGRWDSNPK